MMTATHRVSPRTAAPRAVATHPIDPMEALEQARAAWERSQPQLPLDLWPDDGLDGPQRSALGFVEPAAAPDLPRDGGLTVGDAETDRARVAAATPASLGGVSASPPEHDRPGRISLWETRGRGDWRTV